MRKTKLFAILTVIITMLISVNAFAAVYNGEPGKIIITGGINMEKDYESTFNEARTITGRAEEGSVITIDVCKKVSESEEAEDIRYIVDEYGIYKVAETYTVEIGVSGFFSKSIELFEGENVIFIGNDDGSAEIKAFIRRKSEAIKNRLENGVYIPGLSFVQCPLD